MTFGKQRGHGSYRRGYRSCFGSQRHHHRYPRRNPCRKCQWRQDRYHHRKHRCCGVINSFSCQGTGKIRPLTSDVRALARPVSRHEGKECDAAVAGKNQAKKWAVPVLAAVCLLCLAMMAAALVYTQSPAQGNLPRRLLRNRLCPVSRMCRKNWAGRNWTPRYSGCPYAELWCWKATRADVWAHQSGEQHRLAQAADNG